MTEQCDDVPADATATDSHAAVELLITHGVGLHARPSVAFTRLAKSFPCIIEVEINRSGIWFNAKSIVKVMGARIRKGSTLRIRAFGAGAQDAINALEALFNDDFAEDRPHVRGA